MVRPPSPPFRQVALAAASGAQSGASLTTRWRGVAVFTAVALALLAVLIGFVAIVEHAPVHRVDAIVEATDGLVRSTGQDRPLVVRLLVEPSAVDSLRPGVEFRLAFRAYPKEHFGLFLARIDSVHRSRSLGDTPQSAGATDAKIVASALLPAVLQGPHGETLPLRPGMLADALVPGEQRTILEWLLDPKMRGRSDSGADSAGAAAEVRR